MQSNVDLAVLDSKGNVVHWFDGFPRQGMDPRNGLAKYTALELGKAIKLLQLEEAPRKQNQLQLPDLDQASGIRVFVQLMDERMKAYQAPVVEVVPLDSDDWNVFEWPTEQRSVDASSLTKWLSQVYPPGVMERTNPQTKVAYKIKTVTGRLSLVSAGSDDNRRYAILSGNIHLTDDGIDEFSFEGKLEIVLMYELGRPELNSLRGVFSGIYPRTDRMRNQSHQIPLQAVFESFPD